MRRKTLIVVLTGALALLISSLSPAAASSDYRADGNAYVNLTTPTTPKTFKTVTPDVVSWPKDPNGHTGPRVEIYSSVGNNEGGSDWRSVNLFARLVNSVPKGYESYATVFNSLYDMQNVHYDSKTDRWEFDGPVGQVFAPTAAYLNQTNQYAGDKDPNGESTSAKSRTDNIHVLGEKRNITEALEKSSLARLVHSGYKTKSPKAVDYQECSTGGGGCLSTSRSGIMHSKYGAFQQATDSDGILRDNVIFITSANLNGSSGGNRSNVNIVIYDDPTAYAAVSKDIYGSQEAMAKNPTQKRSVAMTPAYKKAITREPSTGEVPGMVTDSGVTLYPSPRYLTEVSNTDSVGYPATNVEGSFLAKQVLSGKKATGCKVYAVHSLFNGSRGDIQTNLAELAQQNCDVRIVLDNASIANVIDGYFQMSTDLRKLVDRVQYADVHDKTLSYKYGSTNTTFGGSANFSSTSLNYDELSFRSDNDASVTDAVQAHSDRIYQRAKAGVKWAAPTSLSVLPASSSSTPLKVRSGGTLQLSSKVSPTNGLITNTTWSSSAPTVATVSADGEVKGIGPGKATITATGESPSAPSKSGKVYVAVAPDGTASVGSTPQVTVPPVLTMDRYQAPPSATNRTTFTVTWGEGSKDYAGVVKLKYYSGGWKTFSKSITTNKQGVGRLAVPIGSSKTWYAYGARLDRIYTTSNGTTRPVGPAPAPGATAKTISAWSTNTVRTKTATTTPRLYATNVAKSQQTVPLLVAWKRGGGTFRLQYQSGKSWKTYASYKIPSGASQLLIAKKTLSSRTYRIATSSGPLRISNSATISMK